MLSDGVAERKIRQGFYHVLIITMLSDGIAKGIITQGY